MVKGTPQQRKPCAHFRTDLALLEYCIPFFHSIHSILSFPALIFSCFHCFPFLFLPSLMLREHVLRRGIVGNVLPLIGKWRADWRCSHPEDSRGCISGSAPEECMQWVSIEFCSCEALIDTLDNFSRQRRWFNWDAHQVTPEIHIWFINLCCCCFLFWGRGGELWLSEVNMIQSVSACTQ